MKRFLIVVGFLVIGYVHAQTTLQVVTMTVNKSFKYEEGAEVNIEGQKAEINIKTWDKDEIKVVIELTAKHPEKAIAKSDLQKIKYLATRLKNKVYLRNYLDTGNGNPQSLLVVKYNITLPKDCPVYLKNHFGIASLSNLTNRLRINSSFTQIALRELSGFLDVKTRFGDLEGHDLNTKASIQSRRSNINLHNIQGEFDIQAQYGVIRVFANPLLASLKIDADKADVYTFTPQPERVAYNLQTLSTNLNLPEDLKVEYENEDAAADQVQKMTYKPSNQEFYSFFQINVKFGELKVAKLKKP